MLNGIQITRLLDTLFERFRNRLAERGIPYHFEDPQFDLATICGEICAFMDIEGFGQPNRMFQSFLFHESGLKDQ